MKRRSAVVFHSPSVVSMRSFVASAFLIASGSAQSDGASKDDLVNDPTHIDRFNSVDDSLWVAAPQKFFDGWTMDEARQLLGARLSHISNHLHETLPDTVYEGANGSLPGDFDARETWKDLIHPIRDQQRCGSCWAFSASEVLSDRMAVATGKPSPVLSAEDLVSCDKGDHGCQGGYLSHAWAYMTETGIVTDTCFPYTAGRGLASKCVEACVDSEDFTRTKAKTSYAIKGPMNMQSDLMQNGPIQVAFLVYRSFMSYQSGIYHKHKGEQAEGGHAVKIVGWGVHGKTKYWTVANSWNTNWGEDGFFRIRRGKDECGIETMGPPYAGSPLLPTAEDVIVV